MRDHIDQYTCVVLVAGSRSFNNYVYFSREVEHRLALLLRNVPREDICFISGAASRGADAMIIRWCKQNNYPCFKYPADWDNLGKKAGYVRNIEMAKVTTHALLFWDRVSKGTRHMYRLIKAKRCEYVLYGVKVNKPSNLSRGHL